MKPRMSKEKRVEERPASVCCRFERPLNVVKSRNAVRVTLWRAWKVRRRSAEGEKEKKQEDNLEAEMHHFPTMMLREIDGRPTGALKG